jgi:flagellar protein FliO/FliZ
VLAGKDRRLVDQIDLLRYFAALLIVLGLLGGFAVVARRAGWTGALPGLGGLAPRPSDRRLGVREALVLDPRRRVVIIRADDTEHVLLLGAERELLLDSRPAKPDPVFEPVTPDADTDAAAPEADSPAPRIVGEAS